MKKSAFLERNDALTRKPTTVDVVIRWWDGYIENFECVDMRFGSDLLWMRLKDGKNRHIPLRHVRWFSVYPESHKINTRLGLKE